MKVSNCCGAPLLDEFEICSDCKEPCAAEEDEDWWGGTPPDRI